MATITPPKLPIMKLGIVYGRNKTRYYYVQTYTHHYDKEKKRSVRDSQKTVGTVIGGEKYGRIKFKPFFLQEYPELESFVCYWTEKGIKFEVANEEDFSLLYDKPVDKKLAGASWALQKIMGQSSIGDALRDVFNKHNRHLKLASLIIYMIIKKTNVMHNYEPFAVNHFLPWSKPLNDAQIHNLFKSISDDDIYRFFNALNRHHYEKYGDAFYKNLFVALDSTSISTYSNNLAYSDYGHNKDGDTTPQINYLMVCDEASALPIYGKIYKGNVVDVSTVKNLLRELKIMYSHTTKSNEEFSPNLIFVTDRGYDSEDNLQDFLRNKYSFVMRSRVKSKWVTDEILDNMKNLKDYNSLDTYVKQNIYTTKVKYYYDEFPVNGKRKSNTSSQDIYLHMYFDRQIYDDKLRVINDNVANARETYNKLVYKLYQDNKTVTAEMLANIKIPHGQEFIDRYCYFNDEGYACINSEAIDKKLQFAGIMVLLSDAVDDGKKAWFAYNNRIKVEKNFQIFKDYLNFNRPYSSNDKVFNAKFLCQFIAAALV